MSVNYDELRQLGMTVGNAMNITATLAAAQADQDPAQYFAENVSTIAQIALDLQARVRAEAGLGAVLVEQPTFTPPGAAAPAQQAQQAYVPPVAQQAPQQAYVPQQAPAPVQAPAAIPHANTGGGSAQLEALWTQFFQDPSQYYDNRASKKGPQYPDFRHKTALDDQGRKVGLYIDGKGVPAWVQEGLRSIGMA